MNFTVRVHLSNCLHGGTSIIVIVLFHDFKIRQNTGSTTHSIVETIKSYFLKQNLFIRKGKKKKSWKNGSFKMLQWLFKN